MNKLFTILGVIIFLFLNFCAIAGSGGWIPSIGVRIHLHQLITVGYCQNKPKTIVVSLRKAARLLRQDGEQIVQIDFRYPNFPTLQRWLRRSGHVK